MPQAELRDAVLGHPPDHILALKNGHVVAVLGQDDGRRHPGGSAADDPHALPVGGLPLIAHPGQIGVRDELLQLVELDGRPLLAQHAVPVALGAVVADGGADIAQGVVGEQDLPRLHDLVLLKKLDDLGDGGLDGAALLTHRHLAVQTAGGLIFDMQAHDAGSFRGVISG